MKTSIKSSKRSDTDVERAIGGQPENDRDAREAGLASATSPASKKPFPRPARPPKKSDKNG